MTKILLLIGLLANLCLLVRLDIHIEECPNVTLMQNFEPQKYLGKWYEIQKYPSSHEEEESKCVSTEFSLNENGTVEVLLTALQTVKGKAVLDSNNPSNVTFSLEKASIRGKYWVLDTDYKSYSLIYFCYRSPNDPIRDEFAWILSRTRKLNETIVQDLTDKLSAMNSTVSHFETTNQTNCGSD